MLVASRTVSRHKTRSADSCAEVTASQVVNGSGMASESGLADVREWYIAETSKILTDADKQLHTTGSIDIEQLCKSLTRIQEDRDLTLKNLGLEISSPMDCNTVCQTNQLSQPLPQENSAQNQHMPLISTPTGKIDWILIL